MDRDACGVGFVADIHGNRSRSIVDDVEVDGSHVTSAPGVDCAGDAHRGASLVVWAIADGRELARHVDARLRGAPSVVPARGQDLPFR
jgi:glutamate synthase (NADPH/NADH) small chain